jgi:hypothetical protein
MKENDDIDDYEPQRRPWDSYSYPYGSYCYPPYRRSSSELCDRLLDELLEAHKREVKILEEKYSLNLNLVMQQLSKNCSEKDKE